MPKKSNLYLDIDPFKIIETSFHKDRSQVSESIFSLANEYSGIRGFFDEGYSGNRHCRRHRQRQDNPDEQSH